MQTSNRSSTQFHLHRIRPIVESYRLPEVTDWSADAAYQMTFDFLSLTIQPRPAGFIRMVRKPQGATFTCAIEVVRRGVDDANFHLAGEFKCRNDQLATPLAWDLESWVDHLDPVQRMAYTVLLSQAEFQEGRLHIQSGQARYRHPMPAVGGIATKWMLMEAVQRWPVDAPPVSFSIVDENDAFWENQSMEWIGDPIVLGGIRLRGLLHLGAGTLPRSFWLNEQGLPLFIVSGTEVAVLASVNGVEASYNRRYTISELSAEPF
jgi:hypothetical protein